MLRLERVSKRYDGVVALDVGELEIERGRTTVLIGPSGCGKSTLLKLLNGLLRPDTGRVLFEGRELAVEDLPERRRRMGYVIQEGGLFPHLTARRNVTLMAEFLGVEPARRERRVAELARLTKLRGALLDRYPRELSGGERQRVSLMRALMLDPDLLLLDEPLGALDPMIRSELRGDLKEIFATLGKTVVLVTHDLAEAASFADRVVLLRAGRIAQQGSLRELLERPAEPFVRRFFDAQSLELPAAGERS